MTAQDHIDALLAAGRTTEAHAAAMALVGDHPDDADARFYLAKCQLANGDEPATAGSLAWLAERGADRFAAYHRLVAQLAMAQARTADVIAALQRANALEPATDTLQWQARLQDESGDAAGLSHTLAAIAAHTGTPGAFVQLGRHHAAAGRVGEAAEAYRRALSLDAQDRAALRLLGALAAETFDFVTARECLARALSLDPADEGLRQLLGFVLAETGEDAAARAVLEANTGRPPSAARRLRSALYLPQVPESVRHIDEWRARYAQGLSALEADAAWCADPLEAFSLAQTNFLLAYHGEDDLPLQQRYAALLSSRLRRARPDLFEAPVPRASGARLRVAFVSSFFRQCTIGRYFESWISGLDPARFERLVFSTGWEPDEFGRALAAHCDGFQVLRGSALSVADALRAARADILIYPEVGMGAQNYLLVNLRLAPVQCAAWGHPVTTGSREIDAYLSCAGMEPPDGAAHYAERLLGLPGIGTSYALPDGVRKVSRAALGIDDAAHLYVCPQSLFKIHPDNDALLVEVVARDPRAVVLFFQSEYPAVAAAFTRRLGARLAERGLDARRQFKFVPRMDEAGFRGIIAAADVVLDTVRWSGGNTSLDALAAGTPIVTWPGRFMRARQTAAMLDGIGLSELIATDAEDYLGKALGLAKDREANRALRARIRQDRGALFDRAEPVAALAGELERLAGR